MENVFVNKDGLYVERLYSLGQIKVYYSNINYLLLLFLILNSIILLKLNKLILHFQIKIAYSNIINSL